MRRRGNIGLSGKVGSKGVDNEAQAKRETRIWMSGVMNRFTLGDYDSETIWGRVAANSRFESGILIVICLNALWIGIDDDISDVDNTDVPLWRRLIEHTFTGIFLSEIVIRFVGTTPKIKFFRRKFTVLEYV